MAARASTGTYTATSNSFNPAVTGTTIDAAAWNAIRTELEVEITDSLNRSGKGGMLADLDMSSNNIINLASASAAHHAVRFDQLTNLSASLASQVATLSAEHSTLSAAHTTLSAAHTTLSAAHTTLSAAFTTLSAGLAQRDYLVLSANSNLDNARVLSVSGGLSANDTGTAGGTFTIRLADLTASSVLGVLAAGTPQGLSQTQLTTLINDFVGDSGSGGTKGAVPAPASGDSGKFLRGDATWTTIPGGGDMLAADAMSAGSYWAASADRWMEPSATWAAANVQTLADAATVTVNFSLGINFKVTLGGNRALLPKNAKSGQSGAIYVSQSGGARTLSCNPIFKWAGGTFPGLSTALSTASGAWDVITYSVLSANFVTSSILKNVK